MQYTLRISEVAVAPYRKRFQSINFKNYILAENYHYFSKFGNSISLSTIILLLFSFGALSYFLLVHFLALANLIYYAEQDQFIMASWFLEYLF